MTLTAGRFLGLCGVLVVASLVMPSGDLQDLVYAITAAAGIGAIVVGTRRHRPAGARGWYLMAAGLSVWLLHDVVYTAVEHAGDEPFRTWVNAIALVGYPLLLAGVVAIDPSRTRTASRTNVIDSLLITCAAAFPAWMFVLVPTLAGAGPGARTVTVVLALGDVLLVAMVAQVALAARSRCPAAWLLCGSLLMFVAGDVVFLLLSGTPASRVGDAALDSLWMAGYVLWGAAALHPSMRLFSQRYVPHDASVGMGRLFAVAAALGVSLVTLLVGQAHGASLALFALVALALVTVRMIWMVRRLRDQAVRLEQLANVDVLTGLENRRRFIERMDDHFADPAATGVLVRIALERYTEISDTLGHRVGHELLRAVAERLQGALLPGEYGARLGGDSFAVLLTGRRSVESAHHRATQVCAAFAVPFALSDLTVTVNAVVGTASFPQDATATPDLRQKADLALVAARGQPGRVVHYAEHTEIGGTLVPQLMTELRHALERSELVVHYQPQVELSTGRVLGVEALVRWQHPKFGLLAPAAFVPAAERTGLIRLLTVHVLDRTVAQAASWRAAGLDLMVSVNMSVRDLLAPDFVEDVRRTLTRHGIAAGGLELEITETSAMVDPNRSVEVLGELSSLGVHLAVDDYGTGYSSLAYLQRLPVRRLKIDRSFVAGVLDHGPNAAIVRSTIELARHLGLEVVAEGVEDDETLLSLLEMSCAVVQGFGLGRPVPAEEIPPLVAQIELRVPELTSVTVPAQRNR